MLKLIKDTITLPEISTGWPYDIETFKEQSKLVTYVHTQDIVELGLTKYRPRITQKKQATIWSTSKSDTLSGYEARLESTGIATTHSLAHVFWLIDNHSDLLNTTEKNENNDYIGNFFFINKIEIEGTLRVGEKVVVSAIRRNCHPLEFGLRFYSINDPRIFKAKDRRIISL